MDTWEFRLAVTIPASRGIDRRRPPAPILYTIRIALFLIMSGVLTLNLIRYPFAFSPTARALAILAAVVGVAGAVYFGRKLVRRI